MTRRSVLVGTGSALPVRAVSNLELSERVDTSDEWIVERTGIRSRHLAGEGETTASLATDAARAALTAAGVEAKDMGFATHVADDPHAKAMELARVIANKNPHAMRGAKRLCNLMGDASDAALLQAESDEQIKVIRTPNQMEAVMAEMQKRKPNFQD